MAPADLLVSDRENVRGVILEEASATAHVAIVTQALEIPLIGWAEGILGEVEPGDGIIVNGDNAQIFCARLTGFESYSSTVCGLGSWPARGSRIAARLDA